MKVTILCDFDGTITKKDTGVVALENYSTGDWLYYEKLIEEGKISLEECIKAQFGLLEGKKEIILETVEKKVSFRNGFEDFMEFCFRNSIPLVILSAGLDFIIHHYMKKVDPESKIPIYSPQAHFNNGNVSITFPEKISENSKNFKTDIAMKYKRESDKIIYIGDGLSDYEAVRVVDFSYVVEGTKLAEQCINENIPHKKFSTFYEIIEDLHTQIS
jgi:2-hydroxy-3-keto-5-methylthiopentenyl-1-phosphate phosphatase